LSTSESIRRDEILRAAVLAGDESAWRAWYDEAFDPLCRFVRWRLGGRGDLADEIVQEAWLTAVRRVRHFDPQRGSFLAWMRGIAANSLRNHLRRQGLRAGAAEGRPEPADGGRPHPMEERERQLLVAAALAALSDRHEAVLREKYLDGLSVADIAAAWNESPKAIESLLGRAREEFRRLYGRAAGEA
jgi:RNA polymerase sigma-70 factor, ECF subfamily